MHKLRLALVLPVVQCIGAAFLLRWGYNDRIYDTPPAHLICRGLNAPALLFRFMNPIALGEKYDWLPRSMLGFDTSDLFFLVGVVVVWYLVGHALDHRQTVTGAKRRSLATALIVNVVLIVLGVLFLLGAQYAFARQLVYYPYSHIRAVLLLAWGLGLTFFSIRGLIRDFVKPVALRRRDSGVGGA